jgi:hypothetical protein
MTPRMLYALRKRHLQRLQREELLNGIVAAAVANFGFCRPEKPLDPQVFMLHPLPAPKPKPLTGDSLAAMVRALPRAFVQRENREN